MDLSKKLKLLSIMGGAIFLNWLLYRIGLFPFIAFPFQALYFIATGWIYYTLSIDENINLNVPEIALTMVLLLVLLIAVLHIVLKWTEFRRFRNKTPMPLTWTVVFAVLMLVIGISSTALINQVVWITKTPEVVKRDEGKGAKLRAVELAAKGAVSDLQGYLDSYMEGKPYIIVTEDTGKQGCIEAGNATVTDKTCQALYNQTVSATYTPFPDGMSEIISDFINHHIYKGDKSPYTGLSLFVATHTTEGEVVLTPVSSRAINIKAYASDLASPIFDATVRAQGTTVGGQGIKEQEIDSRAREAVSELQNYLQSYITGTPYRIRTDNTDNLTCIEAANASATGKTCLLTYHKVASATYAPFPNGMDDVISTFINYCNNYCNKKVGKSLFTGLPLFVTTHTTQGEIVLTPLSGRAVISVTAYAEDVTEPIFSTFVTALSK